MLAVLIREALNYFFRLTILCRTNEQVKRHMCPHPVDLSTATTEKTVLCSVDVIVGFVRS